MGKDTKKKTILVIREDITVPRGADRVLCLLMNEWVKYYNVCCISLRSTNRVPAYQLDPQINTYFLFDSDKRLRCLYLFSILKILKISWKEKVNVVISVGVVTLFLSMALKIFVPIIKIFYCEHSNLKNIIDKPSRSFLEKIGILMASKVITLTEKDKNNYIKEFHLRETKVDFIYNFVDSKLIDQKVEYQSESKKIISVGMLTKVKAYDRLVKIASKVLKDTDWEWHIYGEGPERHNIETWIRENELENKLILKGNVSNIYELYSDYSFFVMTSYFEGLPMVLLEAQANRLPVISFDCETGPSEIIEDGVNGILVENGNLEEMVEKMKLLMEDKELRIKYSRNSTKNLDKFSKEEIIEKWKLLIEGTK